jgi:sulfite oxidase
MSYYVASSVVVSSCERAYTSDEVSRCDGENGRPFWVTYKGSVYDVTAFRAVHPGGKFIDQAAGGAVEPFWAKWALHFESDDVKAALAENRVGAHVKESDEDEGVDELEQRADAYAFDPKRDPALHTSFSATPYDCETRTKVLGAPGNFYTPNAALYVRNHAPVPVLDASTHLINFSRDTTRSCCAPAGAGASGSDDDTSLSQRHSLKELLAKFPTTDVVSVLQCAGNRQTDDFKATGRNGFSDTVYMGLRQGMVGNVRWTGVRLDAVMRELYPKECKEDAMMPRGGEDTWHVIFTGADEYETSTPLSVILNGDSDCMLATGMNGEPLMPDHGYPVRALLPGIAGARNVKWLESVRLSRTASTSPWMEHYYRRGDGSHVQQLPLQSILFSPNKDSVVKKGSGASTMHVNGVAYTGGDNTLVKAVEVTGDGGKTWSKAKLLKETGNEVHRHAWVRFSAEVPVDTKNTKNGKIYIYSRAKDSEGNVQPEVSPKQRGYLYAGWGKASAKVV